MKKNFTYILFISLIFFFSTCRSKKGSGENGNTAGDSTQSTTEYAVCIWDRTPVRETPEEKGKWLASLNLGEKCTSLDDSKEINTSTKKITYYKIQLLGGREGWVQSDFVVLSSRPAAFVQNTDVYSRPDLLTKTSNSFSKMDIVAVKSTQNGFVEVVGKRKAGKWIETAWVKEANLTYQDVDIAVAKFAVKALDLKDNTKRIEAINNIVNNSDFSASVFINELTAITLDTEELKNAKIDSLELNE